MPAGHGRKAPGGFFFFTVSLGSQQSPPKRRAITFVDGQNLYRCAKDIFGCTHPNYDVSKLCRAVCDRRGLFLSEARFYTGVPDARDNAYWCSFWSKKLLSLSRQGVHIFRRSLRYRNETIPLTDGTTITRRQGREKGVDVRIAIDLITLAYRRKYDVAVVFSQDQDLSEVAAELKRISREQERPIEMISAFPFEPGVTACRGINNTEWFRIDRQLYDACIDPHDYRERRKK